VTFLSFQTNTGILAQVTTEVQQTETDSKYCFDFSMYVCMTELWSLPRPAQGLNTNNNNNNVPIFFGYNPEVLIQTQNVVFLTYQASQ